MKTTYKILGLAVLMAFNSACSRKDDNAIAIQPHDKNEMMSVMHSMMTEMESMKVTQDPDIDFAMMMKMHHMGAIEMAELQLKSGKNDEMKMKAQTIIDTQKKEISQLDAFLAKATPATQNMEFHMMMKDGMDRMSRQADLQIINGNTDQDFATLMIEHHRSATEMAQLHLTMGKDASLKQLSSSIIEEQNKEITEFQEWLLSNRN